MKLADGRDRVGVAKTNEPGTTPVSACFGQDLDRMGPDAAVDHDQWPLAVAEATCSDSTRADTRPGVVGSSSAPLMPITVPMDQHPVDGVEQAFGLFDRFVEFQSRGRGWAPAERIAPPEAVA